MNLIVCLDDENGMLFNKRRQSTDRHLRSHLLTFVGERTLWMSTQTASQFSDLPVGVKVAENFLVLAGEADYCFVEDSAWEQYAAGVREIVVYRWNRIYPADTRFPASELERRKLISRVDFAGFSHERITQEIYCI